MVAEKYYSICSLNNKVEASMNTFIAAPGKHNGGKRGDYVPDSTD